MKRKVWINKKLTKWKKSSPRKKKKMTKNKNQ